MEFFRKEEKKVEYLELIYDLIFVYMIGRDNSLLENIQNGFVLPSNFLMYMLCTLSIIQIWNFTTFYINMFGRNGARDHVFLLTNMYLMYFIGEATRINFLAYVRQYHIAWGLILINIGLQYRIELRNHRADPWNQGIIRRMYQALFSEAILVFIAAFLPALPAAILSFIAICVGVGMTVLGRMKSIGGQVDFMHLTERAMLYVVFTFGEMVIAIASYFTGGGKFDLNAIYFSLMTFLIATGLFLSYEIVYDYLVNREGEFNGLVYMLIHILIIFSLNNITVSFEFMREEEIADFPKIVFLAVSLIMYFLFLFLLRWHFKLRCRPDRKFIAKMALLSALFVILMIIFRDFMAVNILLSVLYTFASVLVLFRMKAVQEEIQRQK